MNFFRKNIVKLVGIFFILTLPLFLTHADFSPSTSGKLTNPIPNVTTLTGFLKIILTAVIKIGIPLVVLAIIYSGFLFVTAMGNTEKLGKAKDALLWSLVGAAVLLGSWAIAEIIVVTVTKIK